MSLPKLKKLYKTLDNHTVKNVKLLSSPDGKLNYYLGWIEYKYGYDMLCCWNLDGIYFKLDVPYDINQTFSEDQKKSPFNLKLQPKTINYYFVFKASVLKYFEGPLTHKVFLKGPYNSSESRKLAIYSLKDVYTDFELLNEFEVKVN